MGMEYDIGSLGMGEQIELDGGVGLGLYHYHDNVPSTDGMGLAQAPAPPQAPAPVQAQVQQAPAQAGLALNPQPASTVGATLMKSAVLGVVAGGVMYGIERWRKDDDAAFDGLATGALVAVATFVASKWA